MRGIISYAAYVPRYRLDRQAIATPPAIGVSAASKGTRSVASFDEDSITLAIEAARIALAGNETPGAIYYATGSPPYLEKANGATIHAAFGFESTTPAIDFIGSPRAAAAALDVALMGKGPVLVTAADIRTSLPGGADERDGGDAAAALLIGDGPAVVAEYLGGATLTEDLLDRWRVPGEPAARRWEERFGQEIYVPLGVNALSSALEKAGLAVERIDRLVVSCANGRAASLVARASKVRREALADDLFATIGNTGAAHGGLLLARALDAAAPGEIIALVTLADGATAHIFRTTDAHVRRRAAEEVPALSISYNDFLIWRGMLGMEAPRRPPPADLAAPAMHRSAGWKLAYNGTKCGVCGELHFPPQRVCRQCGATDGMEIAAMAGRSGTVVTALIDKISWTLAPPAGFAVVNLDGGGRVQCEVTEANGVALEPGDPVELVLRRLSTSPSGVHNYFWKVRRAATREQG